MKHMIAVALALLIAACVADPPPLSPAALAATADPPRHPTHPARNRQLVIPSGPVRPELGRPAEMNALFFLAAGPGPKPTMLLLHGLPGNERNLDLAQAVRRAGWNVLTFTYRGAWGSEGTFSTQHAVADAQAALDFLRSPRALSQFQVNPSRIVLAGHSMGGYMAAHTAANDAPSFVPSEVEGRSSVPPNARQRATSTAPAPPLAGLILLDAWDIAATARQVKAAGAEGRAGFIAMMDDIGHALGPITAADLADNLIRRGEEWDLPALAPKLARLPLLSVYARHGGMLTENQSAAAAFAKAGAKVTAKELETDHAFADKRIALATAVVRWLEDLRGKPAL